MKFQLKINQNKQWHNFYFHGDNKNINWVWIILMVLFINVILWINPIFGLMMGFINIILLAKMNVNLKTRIISIIFMIVTTSFSLFNKWEKIELIPEFEKLIKYSLRDKILNYIKSKYDKKTAEFIYLTLFNIKIGSGRDFFNNLNKLSIGHLAVVSGFHFNVIFLIVNKALKKFRVIRISGLVFVMIALLYFQNMNYSILISVMIFLMNNKHFKLTEYIQKLSCSLSLILTVFPHSINNLGFQLSAFSRVGIFLVLKLKIKDKFLSSLVITLVINLLIWPMIGNINHFISLWTFVLSYFYSGVFIINFLVLFFFFPLFWFQNFFLIIFELENTIFKFFISVNFEIMIVGFNYYSVYFYNLVVIGGFVFLIEKKEKIKKENYNRFKNSVF